MSEPTPGPDGNMLQRSLILDWDQIPPIETKTGSRRPLFKSPTTTLKELSVHVTTLNPGERAHQPHSHPEEEMILLKEGTLEALHNGEKKQMSAGSVLLIASNDFHGVTNNGKTQATYYVIKWFVKS